MWCGCNTLLTTSGLPWMMLIMPVFFLLMFGFFIFAFRRRRFHWCGNWGNSSFPNSNLAHEIEELRKEIEELRKSNK